MNHHKNFKTKSKFQIAAENRERIKVMCTLETEFYAISKFLEDNKDWLDAEDLTNCYSRMTNLLDAWEREAKVFTGDWATEKYVNMLCKLANRR